MNLQLEYSLPVGQEDVFVINHDDVERFPWDMQENEPLEWYTRFKGFYLPILGKRSVRKAYIAFRKDRDDVDYTGSVAAEWLHKSYAWAWEQRAKAYDLFLAEQDFALWEKRRRDLREQEFVVASQMMTLAADAVADMLKVTQEKALEALEQAASRGKTKSTSRVPKSLKPVLKHSDVARYVDTASKIARLATGMETERKLSVHADMEAKRAKRWDRVASVLGEVLEEDIVEGDYEEEEAETSNG